MKYYRDDLYLIIDFLEERLEEANWGDDKLMFQKTIDIIKTLIKE